MPVPAGQRAGGQKGQNLGKKEMSLKPAPNAGQLSA
jgi:hypothetical protein